MPIRPPRLRRSLLITPGSRPERMAGALVLAADGLVLDLEDGVAPAAKADARQAIRALLEAGDFGRRERIVRLNALGSDDCAADLAGLAWGSLDALFVPKVESPAALAGLADRIADEERRQGLAPGRIEIIATIETPRGLWRALDIADASKRTTALFFGSGDYTAATGSAVSERALAVPRALVVAAAAAAGIEAIDAAFFADVKSADAARADALIARELGFAGKLVFHPAQIDPVNAVFTPTSEEVARARRIVAAYGEAAARGDGTAMVDGTFIALDIARMAERTLALARLAGVD